MINQGHQEAHQYYDPSTTSLHPLLGVVLDSALSQLITTRVITMLHSASEERSVFSDGDFDLSDMMNHSRENPPATETFFDTSCVENKGTGSPCQSERNLEEITTASVTDNAARMQVVDESDQLQVSSVLHRGGVDTFLLHCGGQFGRLQSDVDLQDEFQISDVIAAAGYPAHHQGSHEGNTALGVEEHLQSTAEPTYADRIPTIVVSEHKNTECSELADFTSKSLHGTPKILVKEAFGILRSTSAQWDMVSASLWGFDPSYQDSLPASIFALGAQTLKQCYQGVLPSNLEKVLALMRIAVAFQYSINLRTDSEEWDDFSQDIHRWREALVEHADVQIFEEVWHQIWVPQALVGLSTASPGPGNWVLRSQLQIQHMNLALQPDQTPGHQQIGSQNQSQEDVLSRLMRGTVIRGCSRFLDGKITGL